MNILVVDDSASMRQLLKFALESGQHNVTLSQNGQEGLEQAQRQDFELIVSDVNMPVKDGFAMIADIRQMEQYSKTPILMLTTESDGDSKTKGKNAGATGWIIKPFNPEQLLKIVECFT